MTHSHTTSSHPSVSSNKSAKSLVAHAVRLDNIDRFFQSATLKLTRHLKKRPGGRRKWIFDHAAHGTHKPWRAILEMLDLAIDNGAPESDVAPLAQVFATYVHARYAEKELASQNTVREALRLASHAESEAIAVEADALANDSTGNLERVIESAQKAERAEQSVIDACKQRLSRFLFVERS